MPLILRKNKTTPLTYIEMDGNFEHLEDLTDTILSNSDVRGLISVTDAGGDGSLSYNSATGVVTYTGPSAAETRAHFSVSNASGDGTLAYNSSTGVFTYTGPSAAETRAHFSAGNGIDITAGVVSVPADSINDAMLDFGTGANQINTDDLPEGTTNQYYTDARADARIALASIDVLTDVDARPAEQGDVLTYSSVDDGYIPVAPPGATGGEANDGVNTGTGEGIFKQKVGVDLEFKSLIAGNSISITNNANDLTISYTGIASDLDMDNNKIINLADPTANQDSATKVYVDTQVAAVEFDFSGDSGSGTIVTDSETLVIAGTSSEIITSASGNILTIGLPSTFSKDIYAVDGSTLIVDVSSSTVTGTFVGDVTGNADSATAWVTPRTITLAGDTSGSVTLDGSANVTLTTTVAENSVALGTNTTGDYVATIAGTANEIEVTGSGNETAAVIIGLPSDVTIGNDLVVSGNLTVSGTTTTVNTETILLADNVITINSNEAGTPSQDGGIEIERGTSANKTLLWNETNDKWTVGTETFVAATFEGNLTGDVTGNVTGNVTGSSGSTTGNAATATSLETARDIGGVSFNGTANIDLPGVNTAGTQNTSGTAATATSLETARDIGGVSFNGTASINLPGVNTAGNQDTSGTAATATLASTVNIVANNSTNETVYITHVDGATGTQGLESSTGLTFNPSTNTLSTTVFDGESTTARYADLAEIYTTDSEYSFGTVVKLGGDAEITQTTTISDTQVFGVISEHPAYLMNSTETGLPVALSGRISVKVIGAIKKGQRIVSSNTPGVAQAIDDANISNVLAIIGRALESNDDINEKLVECAVGKL